MSRTGFTVVMRDLILTRDEGTCVVCGTWCYDVWERQARMNYSLQHRRGRGMGGSRAEDTNAPQNGVTVCGSATTGCHQRIESQPAWAAEHGYRVPQGADPLTVPITHHAWGLVYLTADGGFSLLNPQEDIA